MMINVPKNAQQLFNRLSYNEKIAINAANVDKLEHLRVFDLAADDVSFETLAEVQGMLRTWFAEEAATAIKDSCR